MVKYMIGLTIVAATLGIATGFAYTSLTSYNKVRAIVFDPTFQGFTEEQKAGFKKMFSLGEVEVAWPPKQRFNDEAVVEIKMDGQSLTTVRVKCD